MNYKNSIRNIAIIAHVDAGKTTLTEQLLYKSGSTRSLGSVDKGTSHTDNLDIERERGISVKSAEIDIAYKGTTIYISDTPGHVDFAGEVQRSLGIIDGAVIVVSCVEGVQPQTEVYFKALKQMKIPCVFFINKLDRIGADCEKTINEIRKLLTDKAVPVQIASAGGNDVIIDSIFSSKDNSDLDSALEDVITVLAEQNEALLDSFYENTLSRDDISSEVVSQANSAHVYPILYGSALKGCGITELLDAIVDYLPAPCDRDEDELSAMVYKITHHKTLGRICHIKVFAGKLQTRQEIKNIYTGTVEKPTVMKRICGQKPVDVSCASSGELVMVAGLTSNIGDILGSSKFIPHIPSVADPLLTVRIHPQEMDEFPQLVEALSILEEEDPLLGLELLKEKRELNIHIMGVIQKEIIANLLKDRFGLDVTFGNPSVIYRETPSGSGYGFERYTMPKPCWAVVKFLIEPLPKGSGVVYESKVRTEQIKIKYQREIENNLDTILKEGYYGWKVTDLKITLVDGEDHVMHSRPGDFMAATAMALMKGFRDIGMTLLEPVIDFRISVPEELSGRILNDITLMRGSFDTTYSSSGIFTVDGRMPVSSSLEYPIKLGIMSSGRGIMSTSFAGFEPCPLELGATKERVGVNPLDRAKWILYVRNAL